MSLSERLQKARESNDYSLVVNALPYAQTLGIQVTQFGSEVVFVLPKRDTNIGNPILPAIHGGVIGGFMEVSASLYLIMMQDLPAIPRIVDFSIDYLRAGLHQDSYAECRLTRRGNRVANLIINA